MKRIRTAATLPVLVGLAAGAMAAGGPSVENPVAPRCALVLENAREPGARVDVAAYRGKPAIIRGVCPE